jgi:hypothetical protein
MAMKYIVTWGHAGEMDFLTIIDGTAELTVDQIMEIVLADVGMAVDEDHEICSIIHADNVTVIC